MNAAFWSQVVRWGSRLLGGHPSSAFAARSLRQGRRLAVEALEDRALLSAGSLGELLVAGTLPRAVLAADFNNDGFLDLAISHTGATTVSIHLSLGGETFAEEMRYLVGTSADELKATDLNGDSRLDLVVTDLTTSEFVMLLGRGDGTFLPGRDSRREEAEQVAGAGGQLVADSGSPASASGSGEERLSPATDFAAAWEGQIRGSGALPPSIGLTGGLSVNVPGVGDSAFGEGMSPTPGAEGPLSFAPLALATSTPLSWGSRDQVPDLLPLRDSSLAVVGTLLSVRQEDSAAAQRTSLPALPVGTAPADELPGAALSRFVSGQEKALENRPPLTREELLRPVEQPPVAPGPGSSAGLEDEPLLPEDTDDSQAGLDVSAPGPALAAEVVTYGVACGLLRAAEVGTRTQPLPPTPSPKRRGGERQGLPPLRFGEGAGGRGSFG